MERQTGKDFVGRIDPDGRFAVWQSKRLERKYVKVSKAKIEDSSLAEVRQLQGLAASMAISQPLRWMSSRMSKLLRSIPRGCDPKGPGSSKESISEKPSKPRGSGGLTRHGARLIRNGGGLMERCLGKRTLSMFTGTFPAIAPGEWELVRLNWSKGWNLFQKKVTYHLKQHNLYTGVVACFEVQMKRNARTGEAGLHVHMLFNARRKSSGPWLVNRQLMEKLWRETWETVTGLRLKWNAATRTEPVAKSVASYLGKYLSKGLQVSQQLNQTTSATPLLPVWYAVSSCVRDWVKRATLKSALVGEFLRHELESESDDILYKNWITLELMDGRIIPITCYGTSRFTNWDIPPL